VAAVLARNFDSFDDWATRMYWKRPQTRIATSVQEKVREAMSVLLRKTIFADTFLIRERVWNDSRHANDVNNDLD
jgi:hypothetical protein